MKAIDIVELIILGIAIELKFQYRQKSISRL